MRIYENADYREVCKRLAESERKQRELPEEVWRYMRELLDAMERCVNIRP